MLKIYRQIYGKYADKFPKGREYLLDNETKQHAKFNSIEEIINFDEIIFLYLNPLGSQSFDF